MLERITEKNYSLFDSLCQDYEEEFSPITKKEKNKDGRYPLDSDWKPPYEGYYWKNETGTVGFSIINQENKIYDIAEFYIIPKERHKKCGENMARALFDQYRGKWQVRQIAEATEAQKFWLRVVERYTSGNFKEDITIDPLWGKVTRQQFDSSECFPFAD